LDWIPKVPTKENEPLFDGKELKAIKFQLIVYDFEVCILSEPELTDCGG